MKTQNLILKSFVVLTTLGVLAGCSGRSTPTNQDGIIDAASIEKSAASPQDKAEALALAGEKIAYGPGFMHAAEIFDVALEFDSTNVRARFYNAMLAPAIQAHGILARVEPAVEKAPWATQQEFRKQVAGIPDGEFKNYLLDGQPNITTEKDVQDFVRSVQQTMRDSRKVMGDLASQDLTIHAMVPTVQATSQDLLSHCQVDKIGEDVFQVQNCNVYDEHDYKLNYADWEGLRLGISVYEIYFGQGTIYDLTGAQDAAQKLVGSQATPQDVISVLKQESQLGKLVDTSTLQDIRDMGAEGAEAIKTAFSKQGELCQTGESSDLNRPGFLFQQGFCTTHDLLSAVPMVEAGLRGPVQRAIVVSVYGDDGSFTGQYGATLDATKFLNGSVTDLKTLLPDQFDNCGQPTAIPDNTLGGILPDGDFVTLERASNPTFLRQPCMPVSSN